MIVSDAKEKVVIALFDKYDKEKLWAKDFLRECTNKSFDKWMKEAVTEESDSESENSNDSEDSMV